MCLLHEIVVFCHIRPHYERVIVRFISVVYYLASRVVVTAPKISGTGGSGDLLFMLLNLRYLACSHLKLCALVGGVCS